MDSPPPVTRRELFALVGTAALAGCSTVDSLSRPAGGAARASPGPNADVRQEREVVRAFVGSYHWGFVLLDADGSEMDGVTLSPGDELRLTLFNVEADAAVDALPRAVRRNLPGADERARRNEQTIPAPAGTSLETLHEAAEAAYPDHGLAIVDDGFLRTGPAGPGGPFGPGGGMGPGMGPGVPHGPGMGPHGPWMSGTGRGYGYGILAPPVYLWHRATVPSELGFVVDTGGSFGFACHVYCGYGHAYMADRGRIVVDGA